MLRQNGNGRRRRSMMRSQNAITSFLDDCGSGCDRCSPRRLFADRSAKNLPPRNCTSKAPRSNPIDLRRGELVFLLYCVCNVNYRFPLRLRKRCVPLHQQHHFETRTQFYPGKELAQQVPRLIHSFLPIATF